MREEIRRKFKVLKDITRDDIESSCIGAETIEEYIISKLDDNIIKIKITNHVLGVLIVDDKKNNIIVETEIDIQDALYVMGDRKPVNRRVYIIQDPGNDVLFWEVSYFEDGTEPYVEVVVPTLEFDINKPYWVGEEIKKEY